MLSLCKLNGSKLRSYLHDSNDMCLLQYFRKKFSPKSKDAIDICLIGQYFFAFFTAQSHIGMERRPDLDTSGNRCAKLDVRYPTRLSAKVLISRMTVYSILIVTFSLSAQSSQCPSSENCCPGNRLAYSLNKAENIEDLSNPQRVKPTQTRP